MTPRASWPAYIVLAGIGCSARTSRSPDEFAYRIEEYLETRAAAVRQVGAVTPTATSSADRRQVDQLAHTIQAFRRGYGTNVLVPRGIGIRIRRDLARRFEEPDGADLRAAVSEVPPMQFTPMVNGRYPNTAPRATVPPSLLKVLPPLPSAIEYRFVGLDLVLLDRNTSVILDIVRDAIPPV
jgi:hypothetical protein